MRFQINIIDSIMIFSTHKWWFQLSKKLTFLSQEVSTGKKGIFNWSWNTKYFLLMSHTVCVCVFNYWHWPWEQWVSRFWTWVVWNSRIFANIQENGRNMHNWSAGHIINAQVFDNCRYQKWSRDDFDLDGSIVSKHLNFVF